jgi:SAM-dependent methyltransferase
VKPSELLNLLSVPGSNAALRLIVSDLAGDEPFNGWIEDADGQLVGRLNAFRFEFVEFETVSDELRRAVEANGPQQRFEQKPHFISAFDERIAWSPSAFTIEDYIKGLTGENTEDHFTFVSTASRIDLGMHCHGWSGIASVRVNGQPIFEVDLFNLENAVLKRVRIDNPLGKDCVIEVFPTGARHPNAQLGQILLEGIFEYDGPSATPIYAKPAVTNRGGKFHPRFFELLEGLDADAVVLDVGGGKRQLDDRRYLNLEYSRYEEPDILGDGTRLPFKNASVDLVYTAAVLEHVRDPLAMGREIHRVLKPGGKVLANAAFMQPIHSEGQHFFNVTPYGLDLIFEQFRDRSVWWDTDFAFMINWFLDVAGLSGRADEAKLDAFRSLAAELGPLIGPDRKMYIASDVWLEATS